MRPVARDVRPPRPSVLAAAGVVVLLLWMAAGPVAAPAQLSELLVETNVSDAVVEIDGEQVGQTNEEGQVLIEGLRPGTYTVKIRHPGYWTASTRTTLEADLTSRVSLTLTSRPGEGSNLLVETNVPAAVVEVDGEQVGQTGPDGRAYATGLIPGTHRVVVRKSGYQPARRTVTFDEAGLDRTIQLRLLPGGPTVADSAVPPPDTGEAAPLTAEADEPARTDTTALASPDTAALDTAARDTTARDTTARAGTAAPAPSRLLVDAGVAGARVMVGDSVYGRTGPDGRLAVQTGPGTHEVRVRKEGFQPVQTVAQLVAGEALSLSLPLSRAPTASDPLSEMSDNFLYIFLAALAGLTGIVATFVGIAGWRQGTFTRWLKGGKRFDRYNVLEVLQRSEYTTVYLASDPPDHPRLALAVLDDPYAARPTYIQQFLQKGRTLQKVREHAPDAPVLEVYQVGREHDEADGRPFIAHEHLSTNTLLSHLKEVGRLDTGPALAIIRQVCVGLRAIHEVGTHHGAVTPENVIVTQTDPAVRIKLIGFGMREQSMSFVRKTIVGSNVGSTTAYVAPEQLKDEEGDRRSDMYAVGMLFYKLVTGTPPYAGDTPARLIERLEEEPRPSLPDSVPGHVKPMFDRMISTDPERRPTAARAVSVLDLIETTT